MESDNKGVIVKTYVDDLPVIWNYVNEMPAPDTRSALPWLTIISWKYDGSDGNGMPQPDVNEQMITLEDAIEDAVVSVGFCERASSRTGSNLKEFAYYINDRDLFIDKFNSALSGHNAYPIEINFYEDAEWEDFQKTLDMLDNSAEQDA